MRAGTWDIAAGDRHGNTGWLAAVEVAPGRSTASVSAAVQSPSPGRRTVSTAKPSAGARATHSSTGEEWSSSSTSTREPAGSGPSALPAEATP